MLGYGLRAITACFLPMLIAGTYGNIGQFKIVMRVVEENRDSPDLAKKLEALAAELTAGLRIE